MLSLLLVSLPSLAGAPDDPIPKPSLPGTPEILRTDTQATNIPQSTPYPLSLITQVSEIHSTLVAKPPFNALATDTFATTLTPPTILVPSLTQIAYLPIIYQHQIPTPPSTPSPTETVLFCDSLSQPLTIPDNDPAGVNNDISINDGRVLVNLRLYLDLSHTWVGDLVVKLRHQTTGQSITVLNRPGVAPYYCSNNDIVAILDDAAAQPADDQCASYPHAIAGIYLPSQTFASFSGAGIGGTWRLSVSDNYLNDTGALNHWCLQATVAESMSDPTPTPTPISLPSNASISGMSGQDQQLTLDCESRSAVDWAKHFGVTIDEIGFLNHLPVSDDPEAGFVGNPEGNWGNIPPYDYGVHAAPVAALLRDYGLTATSYYSLQWDDLRAEIASGNPVIVWIIGGANYYLVNGTPHLYTAASTGNTMVVAPWEHTVILVGYTPDTVTTLNGAHFINIPLDQFLDSWSALDFMAVMARP
jgi:subtilisin-like proprotein convertase family protein